MNFGNLIYLICLIGEIVARRGLRGAALYIITQDHAVRPLAVPSPRHSFHR